MANGTAVALSLVPELSSTPTKAAVPTSEATETAIGLAVASAATALAQTIGDYQQDGAPAPATREASGIRLARVSMLMLDHARGDSDFIALAHRAGRQELRRLIDASIFQKHGPAEIDKALDFYIDGVLEIVGAAVRDERIFRATRAS